jgi:hypothetical protein
MIKINLSEADFQLLLGMTRVGEANAPKMRENINDLLCWSGQVQEVFRLSHELPLNLLTSMNTMVEYWESVERLREAARDVERSVRTMKIAAEQISPAMVWLFEQLDLLWRQPLDKLPLKGGNAKFKPRARFDQLLSEMKATGSRRVGRPPSGRVYFRAFSSRVLHAVSSVGGRLTFDKNYLGRGTLVPALRLLASYLPPPGPVPEPVPISILADVFARSRRGEADENSAIIDDFVDNFRQVTGLKLFGQAPIKNI